MTELRAIPIDGLEGIKTIEEFQAKTINTGFYSPSRREIWANTSGNFMNIRYNFDYRQIPADYETNMLYFFSSTMMKNGKELHPKEFIHQIVERDKKNVTIQPVDSYFF